MKKIIKTDSAPAPIGPYNQAVLVNDTLYISGQIAIDVNTGDLKTENIEDETRLVLTHLGSILNEAGMVYNDIVKCSIFIKDMRQFTQINRVYGEFFNSNEPARETVEVACLPKNVNVEISAVAVKA